MRKRVEFPFSVCLTFIHTCFALCFYILSPTKPLGMLHGTLNDLVIASSRLLIEWVTINLDLSGFGIHQSGSSSLPRILNEKLIFKQNCSFTIFAELCFLKGKENLTVLTSLSSLHSIIRFLINIIKKARKTRFN